MPLADTPDSEQDRDHVPPEKVFAEMDRRQPLILQTHKQCHQDASVWDQVVTEFISLLYDGERIRQRLGKYVEVFSEKDERVGMVGVHWQKILGRYLQAFHAALYREFLPNETSNRILMPFPAMFPEGGTLKPAAVEPVFLDIADVLKKCRNAGTYDEVSCYNRRCEYFCVWRPLDNGMPACFFALRLYTWEDLGDSQHAPKRSCMGVYWTGRYPPNATREPVIEVPRSHFQPLNPFSS